MNYMRYILVERLTRLNSERTLILLLNRSIRVRVNGHVGRVEHGSDALGVVVHPCSECVIGYGGAVLFSPEGKGVGPAFAHSSSFKRAKTSERRN